MNIDAYTKKEKKWLEVSRRVDELSPYWRASPGGYWYDTRLSKSDYILWLPLEKPVFAGWECWVALGESGMRRRDAPKLLAILNYLGVSKPCFVRESRYVKSARRVGHKYSAVHTAWSSKYGGIAHWSLGRLFNKRLNQQDYLRLPMDLKPYFQRCTEQGWGNKEIIYYILGWSFPTYELIIKIKKSYNTFVGHLYGDEIGEYTKLHRWLYHASQAPQMASLYGGLGDWRDCFHRGIKTRWKNACKELRNCDCDEFMDNIERKYGLFNKKKYGWS